MQYNTTYILYFTSVLTTDEYRTAFTIRGPPITN